MFNSVFSRDLQLEHPETGRFYVPVPRQIPASARFESSRRAREPGFLIIVALAIEVQNGLTVTIGDRNEIAYRQCREGQSRQWCTPARMRRQRGQKIEKRAAMFLIEHA
jgi:hypothetical protein